MELWVYDGKNAEILKDIKPGSDGSYPSFLMVYEDKLYYKAIDEEHGRELWLAKKVD